MGTFDGAIQTKTRVALDGDAFQPEMGSLVGSVFKEDAKVLGTRNELVTGDTTLNFLTNVVTMVNGNNAHTTGGTSNKTIIGIYTKVTMSVYNRQVMAVEMKLTVGATIKTTLGPVVVSCATQSTDTSPEWFDNKWAQVNLYGTQLTMAGLDTTIAAYSLQMSIGSAEAKATKTKVITVENTLNFIRSAVVATAMNIAVARTDISGINPEVRGVRPSIGWESNMPPTSPLFQQ